jgi:hypothetical protein
VRCPLNKRWLWFIISLCFRPVSSLGRTSRAPGPDRTRTGDHRPTRHRARQRLLALTLVCEVSGRRLMALPAGRPDAGWL